MYYNFFVTFYCHIFNAFQRCFIILNFPSFMIVYVTYAIFLLKDSNLKMIDNQSKRRSFLGVFRKRGVGVLGAECWV